eukprot:TRINITY_DN1148_c0_g1_i4.p1 TRINITY_DN1148_c0_g1~~TRINITY_DN1148_c0_g1_i4.p1  ORF type:complete len:131 (-),score=14.47 TRINITY_DN1148_c0_g1_i4:191-583(-)
MNKARMLLQLLYWLQSGGQMAKIVDKKRKEVRQREQHHCPLLVWLVHHDEVVRVYKQLAVWQRHPERHAQPHAEPRRYLRLFDECGWPNAEATIFKVIASKFEQTGGSAIFAPHHHLTCSSCLRQIFCGF